MKEGVFLEDKDMSIHVNRQPSFYKKLQNDVQTPVHLFEDSLDGNKRGKDLRVLLTE